jgi:hypothetical protein
MFMHTAMESRSSVTGDATHCIVFMTNSMQHSLSLKTNSRSANKEILWLLRNLKFYYCVHNSSPLALILSQINLFYALVIYFLSVFLNRRPTKNCARLFTSKLPTLKQTEVTLRVLFQHGDSSILYIYHISFRSQFY